MEKEKLNFDPKELSVLTNDPLHRMINGLTEFYDSFNEVLEFIMALHYKYGTSRLSELKEKLGI